VIRECKDLVGSGHDLILRYYPGIRLEGLSKTTKQLDLDIRSPGPRFERGTSPIRRNENLYILSSYISLLLI
jgi:hypothetical protein